MKKFLALLGAISLTVTSAATVVACGPNENTNNRVDLELVKSSFEEFEFGTTKTQIKTAFEETNSELELNELIITVADIIDGKSEITVEVKPNSTVYNQLPEPIKIPVTISTVKKLIDLELIKNSFEEFEFGTTKKRIQIIFEEANADLDLTQLTITVADIIDGKSEITVEVKPNSIVYNQLPEPIKIPVTISTVKKLIDLELIKNSFEEFEFGTTKKRIQIIFEEANADLDLTQLTITVADIIDGKSEITVEVKPNSTVYNQLPEPIKIPVTISIVAKQVDLQLDQFSFDQFIFDTTKEQIKEQFEEANADLDLTQLTITVDDIYAGKTEIIIKVKAGSTVYNQLPEPIKIPVTISTDDGFVQPKPPVSTAPLTTGIAKYHVLSVGNGAFTYVQVDNKAIILDAGRGRPAKVAVEPLKVWRETKVGWEFVKKQFDKDGIDTIEAIFISHAHEDHTWLLGNVVKEMPVNNIIMPATNYFDTANHLLNDYGFKGNLYTKFLPTYSFLGIDFENLTYYINHDDLVSAGTKNPNDSSIILRFKIFDQTILYTGDADRGEVELNNELLIQKLAEKPVDVYVVPHHGSANSGNERFLDAIGVNLKYAFISGTLATEEWKTYGGGFRFPYPETINFLKQKAIQAEVYVTGVLPQAPLKNDPNFYEQVKGINQSYTMQFSNLGTELDPNYTNELLFNSDTIIHF